MVLTDEQKHAVASWIEEGAKPADVQARLEKEFDIRMTYMEVRFLFDDLKVMPKDPPAPEPPNTEAPAPAEAAPENVAPEAAPLADEVLPPEGAASTLTLKVDAITKAGAMVSGSATFSDGKTSEWYLDQYGRLGMVPSEPGYRPPQQDLMEFQVALEKELVKLGL